MLLLPWRWHILPILSIAGWGISAETCGLDDVFFSWWPLSPSRNSVLIYIYLCTCIVYTSSGYRGIYTYAGSVVQYWWSCNPSQSIGLFFGSARFLCWMPLVVFFGFTNCVLLYDNKTNARVLVTIDIRFQQQFAFCNLSTPRIFLFLELLSEYPIQQGTTRPLYVTSRYSTWILYRGISGFATDCPCDVWCCGLTASIWWRHHDHEEIMDVSYIGDCTSFISCTHGMIISLFSLSDRTSRELLLCIMELFTY